MNGRGSKLTPLGEDDTSGFDDSTTWQLDPMPMATKMQIPRNSAIGARMSSLRVGVGVRL